MKKLLCAIALLVSCNVFAAGSTSNTLSWDYLDTDVTKYGITTFPIERKAEICAGTGPFTEIFQAPAATRTWDDVNIQPGVTYCYRAYALGPGGKSVASNMVSKAVPFGVPVAPGNLLVK